MGPDTQLEMKSQDGVAEGNAFGYPILVFGYPGRMISLGLTMAR